LPGLARRDDRIRARTGSGVDVGEGLEDETLGLEVQGLAVVHDEHLDDRPGGAAGAPATVSAQASVSTAEVDAVLHDPRFQTIESAWRGLKLLLEHAEDAVQVSMLSVPRKHLASRFRERVFEPELEASDPLSLVLLDFDFSHKTEDLAVLGDLANMAKVLQAPLVAAASAGFFDVRYLIQVAGLPDLLGRLGDSAHAGWRSFQAGEAARWTALTLNRYLQRPPYTSDRGGHNETVSESNPDSYLWGRGVWLAGAAVARSVRTHGHGLDLAGSQAGRFAGLPTRAFATAANATAPLATEVTLSEMQVLELSRAAFTPLIGPLRTDAAMIPIAVTTFRLNPGKLTVEGTLAYQLMAGRLAQFCGRLLDEMPAGSAGEVAAFFRDQLTAHLGKLAGEKPEEAVSVELREVEAEGRKLVPMAEIKLTPKITLEGKPAEFGFMLPLRG